MGFKCGIVGLPNVGKSTLFNALTKAGIEASNYPFTTIEPNVGVVAVPDKRLQKISAIVKPKQTVPTIVKFVDIAGLVAGASKGEGLGNKFLANIRETQAIAHVVRCFENPDITHVSGAVDPLSDIEVINTELALADLQTLESALVNVARDVKRGDKKARQTQTLIERSVQQLNEGKPLRGLGLDADAKKALRSYQLLTLKPTLYIANVDEEGLNNNPYVAQVSELAAKEGSEVVTVCAQIEAEIADLSPDEQQEFLASLSLEEPGLHRVIHAGYNLLGLLTFFTAGPKEARAWTCRKGSSAPQAAGAIHTDFEKGFIRAEVIGYDDFIQYNGESGAKEAGKWRQEGKDYIVHDGDVVLFRFNV